MDKEEIHQKLDVYAQVLNEATERFGDGQVALAVVEQVGKDLRMAQIFDERRRRSGSKQGSGNDNDDDPAATEKQIAYLKSLNVDVPPNLMKGQASALIDKALEEN